MSTLISNTIKPTSGDTVTFTDNVSIGGTLTYEDVTNVDSVGIVTARTGIKVAAGQSISPVSGTIAYYGDGSNLTGIEPGVENFVASGTIDNGATVVIKDDGTVGIVTLTTSNTPSVGDPTVFESDRADYISAIYDSDNNKVIIAYKDYDNSQYGAAVVGTVSGTSISFGDPVVFEEDTVGFVAATYDTTNDKVVIAYQKQSGSWHGYAVVGTVSGTGPSATISFGTPVVFGSSSSASYFAATFDPDEGKVVIAFQHSDSGANAGKAIVGTVSGTGPSATITFGTEVQFEAGATFSISAVYEPDNNKVVIAYQDSSVPDGKAVVGTVSGTGPSATISFGTPVVFKSTNSYAISATYVGSSKIGVAYFNQGGSGDGEVIVGTVTGTGITFGTGVQLNAGSTGEISATYDSANDKVVIAYHDYPSFYGTLSVGTVNEDTVSIGTTMVYESSSISYNSVTYDSANEKVAIAYRASPSPYPGTAVVYSATTQTTNLTAENYIGISGEAISNGATGKINITGGINSGQTGLTTAKKYYVGQTGILTTTADTPSVVAGTSISDTEILVWS